MAFAPLTPAHTAAAAGSNIHSVPCVSQSNILVELGDGSRQCYEGGGISDVFTENVTSLRTGNYFGYFEYEDAVGNVTRQHFVPQQYFFYSPAVNVFTIHVGY